MVLEGMRTSDVCDKYIKPVTDGAMSSYCEYLVAQGYKSCRGSAVGIATVFISHAWKCLFLDVVDALEYHFRTEPDLIVWFDLFRYGDYHSLDTTYHHQNARLGLIYPTLTSL